MAVYQLGRGEAMIAGRFATGAARLMALEAA